MQSNPIPVHKLILLFIAREAPGIRRSRLRDAALATLSMDYFDMARALEELRAAGLLLLAADQDQSLRDAEDQEVERCHLSPQGHHTLSALENQIPGSTRRFLSSHLKETLPQRRSADTITSTVEPIGDGSYRLTCRQLDGEEAGFSFSLLLPTENMARRAAITWREKPASVYAALIESLLDEESKKP